MTDKTHSRDTKNAGKKGTSVANEPQKVLVTGGAGFIGSHTTKALAQRGIIPVTIDNLVYGHRDAVRWGPFYEADIADQTLVRRIVYSERIDSMIHFAAFAYVGESVSHPQKYFQNNVSHTLALLDAALDAGVRNVVFSSSCATYGNAPERPIREQDPQLPINPYGESKLFIEKVLRRYGDAYGLKWAVLRYFNAAGADPEGEIGERHSPETHLVPLALFAAMGIGPPLKVFGDDYDTADGSAIRDYIHVSDLAEAHMKALDTLADGTNSIVLNLGCGDGRSVFDVINAVERVTGLTVPHSITQRRAGDPPVLVADATLAAQLIKWQPRYSDIDTIIETAFNFFRRMKWSRT